MTSSRVALGLVVLLLAGLWFVGGGSATPTPSAAAAELVRVSEPVTHDNLTIYFVHGQDAVADVRVATLQEAIAAGWAVVHETENVNQLAVENRSSDTELFIQEGDIIKGGKQDRLIAIDMLLPPNSGRVSFPAHCVEQGRWTGRGQESSKTFHASTKFAVGNELKIANASLQQGDVWKNVAVQQQKLSENVGIRVNAPESASSLQLALENPALLAKVGEYEEALKDECAKRKNVVGVVFVINGKLSGAEIYGSSALFEKAWPKLLNSAATEALAEKSTRSHVAVPSAKEVERFLACGGETQPVPVNLDRGEIRDGTTNAWLSSGRMRDRIPIEQQVGTVVGFINSEEQEVARTVTRFSGRSGETRTGLLRQGGGNRAGSVNPATPRNVDVAEVQDLLEQLPRANSPALAANPQGNRLNINRVGNAAGLVTESRDAGRGNAMIHKSYIKR
jgi:hypothetical protein